LHEENKKEEEEEEEEEIICMKKTRKKKKKTRIFNNFCSSTVKPFYHERCPSVSCYTSPLFPDKIGCHMPFVCDA
jgi:hypothetical protein